jgi:hypothetical protein
VRFAAGLLTGLAVMMLIPADVPVETLIALHVEEVEVETPYADSLVDVDEAERQGACLWEWMRGQEVELTLESVLAAGYWTDTLGGACYLIGEDDVHEED